MIMYVYVKQTVSKAIINMKKVFEYGQAYGKFIFITKYSNLYRLNGI